MKSFLLFCAGFIISAAAFLGLWRLGFIHNSFLDGFRRDATVTVKAVQIVAASDDHYVATLNRAGDALGWCELRLNVNRKGEAFDWEREFVSITGCDTQIDLRWQDNADLSVTYGAADPTKGIHTYQQFRSEDGAVKISYNLKQPE
jgi:hypothetical protein